jgi:hypothetical protein
MEVMLGEVADSWVKDFRCQNMITDSANLYFKHTLLWAMTVNDCNGTCMGEDDGAANDSWENYHIVGKHMCIETWPLNYKKSQHLAGCMQISDAWTLDNRV